MSDFHDEQALRSMSLGTFQIYLSDKVLSSEARFYPHSLKTRTICRDDVSLMATVKSGVFVALVDFYGCLVEM